MFTALCRTAKSDDAIAVTGHRAATNTAIETLQKGGSLADAAIAAAAVLSVALPQACGLGGDTFILLHDAKSNRTEGINASGMSPALATPQAFGTAGLSERGAASVNVPGMVAGWGLLHDRYGRMPWSELMQPAVKAASQGVLVSRVLAQSSAKFKEMLMRDPGSSSLFLQEGSALVEGSLFQQPALAETLSEIALRGARAFYNGDIAQSIANACRTAGGLLRFDDMKAYKAEWVEPISVKYRNHEIRALPPNSYGLYLLLQLLALEDSESPDISNTAARIARLVAAAQGAFEIGARAVADPDTRFGAENVDLLLSETGRQRLRSTTGNTPRNLGGTAVVSLMDRAGNAVTIIQSVFLVFGSGISDPHTGALLNNRLFGFTMQTGHPNEIGPRKRPAHTLCPALVFNNSQLRYALATPGGPGQTLTLAQVLESVLEAGADLQTAIESPRWSMDVQGNLLAEATMDESVIGNLHELGVDLRRAEIGSPYFGSVKGIERRLDHTLLAVADSRRDATAAGL